MVVPFTISCGDCFSCSRHLYAACETTNPGRGAIINKKDVRSGAGMFGYTHLYGGYAGGQAEFVRVPKANVGPLLLPEVLPDEQVLFLSDILPTRYQAVLNAEGPGSTLTILGGGPVGMMAAACARLLGVERIFMVDRHPYRLTFAVSTHGHQPGGGGRSCGLHCRGDGQPGCGRDIEAVGFEAKGSVVETALTNLKLESSSGSALRRPSAPTGAVAWLAYLASMPASFMPSCSETPSTRA